MVVTFLEAHVEPEKATVLEQSYRDAIQQLDAGIARTSLLRGARDPNLWRIETVWESREALETMRNSGQTPRGVLIFRSAGAEPALTVFAVVEQNAAPA
jgi:heme-degrading monooxygenase HmoA